MATTITMAGGFRYSGTFVAGASAPKPGQPGQPIVDVEESGHDVLETFLQAIATVE